MLAHDETLEVFMSTEDVAELLSSTVQYVSKLRRTGGGPPFYEISPRFYRYKKSDVEAWIESKKTTKLEKETFCGLHDCASRSCYERK